MSIRFQRFLKTLRFESKCARMTSRWIRPKRSTFWALALVCGLVQSRAQEFRVSNAEIDSRGQLTVLYPSTTDSYYLLYRGDTLTNILAVAALGLGQDGSGLLSDSATIDGASQAYYRVRQVPLAQSLDVDGDALPDVYELQRSAYLNPLNPADAALDYDGDGKSNLQEFRDGTNPAELPVDPGAVAPPVNPGGPASLADATSFLYSGPNPIQTGVTNGTFDLLRICVLRGKVRQRDGAPLTGVTISVLGQPEYGRTKTRADGMFDFVVNGGGSFTVKYERPGFCPIQRQITTPWNDYVCLPDAVMITMDPVVTPVTMGTNSPIQVAQSSVQADADGARRATVIFPPGTCANLIVNGQTQSCNSLSVRATEFTVGTNGPATMPAALPPSSAYTYCVELSADEADAAGASTVQFTQPLCLYLENFLNFPVGQAVPMGYYDRLKGVWVAAPNGRVIKVLSETGGLAVLDTDGDGNGDSPAQLAALGITDEERQKIAQLYSPLQTLWRACVTHFTPWDCNWPGGPPPGAQSPSGPSPSPNPDNSCSAGGSIIEVERQALGEMVDIVGTPFQLHYRSDRVFGNQAAYTIQIPLSEETLPPNLKRITLTIDVAGRAFTQEFPPTPGQNFNFTWDGFDAYGRFVPRTQPIKVRIGYVYKAVYYSPGEFEQAFAGFTDDIVTANSGRGEVTLWRNWNGLIGNLLIQSLGLGGWTFDVLHRYDSQSRTLHLGGGGRRSANGLDVTIITRFAGGGSAPGASIGDGGAATNAELAVPSGLAVGPDGSVYIAEQNGARVRKVSPAGIISTIAGSTNGQFCLTATNACGDGGPATEAFLNAPQGVAVALDGTVYIADRGTSRVRKVDTNGIITTVAGTGAFGFSGDGGPAVLAQISSPYGVALGPDGSLYIADYGNRRVRRVSADGIITTVAGGMIVPGPEIGDGGPATRAEIGQPWRVAFDADGNMYIVDRGFYRIRRVGIDGIITTIAGAGGTGGYGGDGGPAALALFGQVEDIAVAPDGSFYIADRSNARVRLVGTEGIITTFAGNGSFGSSGDGGPATQARLSEPNGLALGPDGSLYEADWFNQRVRKISSALPGFSNGDLIIPSADGAEIYVFNNAGRHLRTLDAFTRALRYQFSYDPQWRLTAVEDGDHNVTTVERDANGDATAIVSPYGQRTPLTLTANGYLASIANPASERFSFEYTASGLMTTMTNPRTNTWRFFYDTLGRLIEDRDPAGGFKALARTEGARRFSVELRTAMQQTNRYEVIDLPAGGRRRITTFPTGLQSELWEGTDGTRTNRFPEGVVVSEVMAPDPRFGMLASFPRTNITIFP
ncbi:MAG TPA: hypothetical protein VJW76_16050, partial [Verrucomicrobiae bacterium]|nr:hypothetical protein [Verrucomicrobiae bacterium]